MASRPVPFVWRPCSLLCWHAFYCQKICGINWCRVCQAAWPGCLLGLLVYSIARVSTSWQDADDAEREIFSLTVFVFVLRCTEEGHLLSWVRLKELTSITYPVFESLCVLDNTRRWTESKNSVVQIVIQNRQNASTLNSLLGG
jgi:hypothetical protein